MMLSLQDIIFDSKWNMFFDLMIEMAATYKVNVSLDLRKKKANSTATCSAAELSCTGN